MKSKVPLTGLVFFLYNGHEVYHSWLILTVMSLLKCSSLFQIAVLLMQEDPRLRGDFVLLICADGLKPAVGVWNG